MLGHLVSNSHSVSPGFETRHVQSVRQPFVHHPVRQSGWLGRLFAQLFERR